MLVRASKGESFVKLVRLPQPSRKIAMRSELKWQRAKVKRKSTAMSSDAVVRCIAALRLAI